MEQLNVGDAGRGRADFQRASSSPLQASCNKRSVSASNLVSAGGRKGGKEVARLKQRGARCESGSALTIYRVLLKGGRERMMQTDELAPATLIRRKQ